MDFYRAVNIYENDVRDRKSISLQVNASTRGCSDGSSISFGLNFPVNDLTANLCKIPEIFCKHRFQR